MSDKGFDIVAIADKVNAVLDAQPDLDLHGFWHESRVMTRVSITSLQDYRDTQRAALLTLDSLRTIYLLMAWVQEYVQTIPEGTLTKGWNSYQAKHVAEQQIGYVTNGQFIVAAILCGYEFAVDASDAVIQGRLAGDSVWEEHRKVDDDEAT